jgi:glycosyltransferase involved in cell wall biosynthesis
VPYGNVDAIKRAVTLLIENKYTYRYFSGNGRRAYDTKYSWRIMEDKLVNAYKELE